MHGMTTSRVEVTNVDSQGIWLFVDPKEHFLPYEEFPWFKEAKLSDVLNVELLSGEHIHWPSLDVDLSIEILENPQRFSLKAK